MKGNTMYKIASAKKKKKNASVVADTKCSES